MSQPTTRPRPLSPHLSIWKWGPHMAVSILHRAAGVGMAIGGVAAFVWWLAALASGPDSYASFHYWVVARNDDNALALGANVVAKLVAIGLTWALFHHLANGIRHFVMDLGANYELRGNKLSSSLVIAFGVTATVVVWTAVFLKGL